MGNDVAKDIYCDVTISNSVAMYTYHDITMHDGIDMSILHPFMLLLFPNKTV